MNLNPPVIPPYDTAVLEDPAFAPNPNALRFNPEFFQFLQLMRQTMLDFPAPVIGGALSGKITLNGASGIATTEALTTAANGTYTLTLTNNTISEDSNLLIAVSDGTNTGGAALLRAVKPGDGRAVITILNIGSAAFNGTLKINFLVE